MPRHRKHDHKYITRSHMWQFKEETDEDVKIKVEECEHCGDVKVTTTERRPHPRG